MKDDESRQSSELKKLDPLLSDLIRLYPR